MADTLPKILESYMGEVVWPAKPTRAQMARLPRPLAQHGEINALYGSGCRSDALRRQ